MADVRRGRVGDIPRHLQNVHADSSGLEREQGYLYPHSFPGRWVDQQYLPDELTGKRFWHAHHSPAEEKLYQYMLKCWNDRYKE